MSEATRRRFLLQARTSLVAAPLLALGSETAWAQDGPDRSSNGPGGRVSAEDFGAKGDGVADDRAALQSALDALVKSGGGVLLLDNKRYRLGGSLEVDPTMVSISGARAVLDCRDVPAGAAAILVRANPGSPQYDQGTQFIEGIVVEGPGPKSDVIGITLQTAVPLLSSRLVLRNLAIRDVGIGLNFSDRAYLCQSYSLQIFSVGTGVVFASDRDAGENISFYGCSIFNSHLAVENRAGAFANFIGCSFDYCRLWFRGKGMNQFSQCWFEKHRPKEEEDYPFDLHAGELMVMGGGIQISGEEFAQGNQNRYMFMIRDRLARVTLIGTTGWNWRTKSDELAGGAGTISIRGLAGAGKKHMPTALKDDRLHNVFGSAGGFEEKSIRLPCWIDADDATRVSEHEMAWRNGSSTYATSSASITSVVARSGRRSLNIRKGIGPGTEVSFNIAAPVAPDEGFSLRLWYRIGTRSEGPLWFQIYYSQFLSFDGFGVPRIGNEQFWGEIEAEPEKSDQQWRRIAFNSHNLDETSGTICKAPAWATHVRLQINLVTLDTDTDLWIDDVGGWRL